MAWDRLLNARATFMIDDKAHCGLIHGESSSDGCVRLAQRVQTENLGNIGVAEFGVHVGLAPRPVTPTPLLHIALVLSVRFGDQVIGIAAKAIVTLMRYLFAVSDWAVVQFIGDTMGHERSPVCAASGDLAVATLRGTALPGPALVARSWGDVLREALIEGRGMICHSNVSFLDLLTSQAVCSGAGTTLLVRTPVIIPQMRSDREPLLAERRNF